jgi:hypothetical protein
MYSMPSNQPPTKAARVSGAVSMMSWRATSTSAMTLVAAPVDTRMWASSPRAATAADRSGSHVTAASTLPLLNMAAAAGASWVMTMDFSSALRCSVVRPDCERRYNSSQCEGVNSVVAMRLPARSSTDLMDDSETTPSPPRDQSCMRMARPRRLGVSASSEASRAHESTVSHMTSIWPALKAANLAAGSSRSTNSTSMPCCAL